MPPHRGNPLPRQLAISEGDLEQDAKIASLSETIEAPMESFPVLYEILDSGQASPL